MSMPMWSSETIAAKVTSVGIIYSKYLSIILPPIKASIDFMAPSQSSTARVLDRT
jgi:hypothetical protein